MEVVGERAANLADSVDHHVTALQRAIAPEALGDGLHRPPHPERRRRGRVPGAPAVLADPAHMGGDRADQIHVGLGRADVLGGDVATAEAIDEARVGPDQLVAPQDGGIADDHRLAPALIEAGGGVLVGHPPGETADVDEGGLLVGEGVEPHAPEARTEHRGVERHDGAQPAGRVVAEGHLLEPLGHHQLEGTRHRGHGTHGAPCAQTCGDEFPKRADMSRTGHWQNSGGVVRCSTKRTSRHVAVAPDRSTRTAMTQQDGFDAPDTLLTPSEVAAMFRVNPKTVTRWARSGKLSAIRTLGGHRRFKASEIRRCLEEMSHEPGLVDPL